MTKKGPYVAEYKLDGERMLMHFERSPSHEAGQRTQWWSRNNKNATGWYGEAMQPIVNRCVSPSVESVVLDGELMVYDGDTGDFAPFGMNRSMAAGILEGNKQPCFVVFDILWLNGRNLTQRSLAERRRELEGLVAWEDHSFELARQHAVTGGTEEMMRWLDNAMLHGYEGVMLKSLASPYVPGSRDNDWQKLKRVARYLITVPRLVMQYPWQPLTNTLTVYTDSDHAGCLRTRKSTSGGVVVWGQALLKAWSRTQTLIALSSGESELAAVTKAAAEGLGIQSVLADFGMSPKLELHSDATAAIGICKRQGLGRVRHLATADLWVQQKLRSRELKLYKLPGKDNPSDLMTKHKTAPEASRFMAMLGIKSLTGRPALSPSRVPTKQKDPPSESLGETFTLPGVVGWPCWP